MTVRSNTIFVDLPMLLVTSSTGPSEWERLRVVIQDPLQITQRLGLVGTDSKTRIVCILISVETEQVI